MCGLLALLFIAVPALEIYLLIEVGSALGAAATLAIIVVTALLGAALARHQGLAAVRRLQESIRSGREIGQSLIGAALVLVAAVTLLTPGFVTDAVGLALLLPPVRRALARRLARYAASRATTIVVGEGVMSGFGAGAPGGGREDEGREEPPPPGVIDV